MDENANLEAARKADSLAGAIRSLTIAVWCLCVVVLALLAFYFFSFYRSWASVRESMSSSASSTGEQTDAKSFFEMPPEERIKRSTVILLTKHQKDGGKLKAVVVEILKQPPTAKPRWSVGDEVVSLSHYGGDETTYGDGDVVFFVGSTAHFRESVTYRNDRITGMGDMPLETLREIVRGRESAPRPAISPNVGAPTVTYAESVQQGRLIDLEETTNGEGLTRVFSIPTSAASRIPEWLPEKGEPPFAMSKAVRLATDAAQAGSPQHPAFVARAIRIQLVSCDEPVGNRWYYVLECVPRQGGGLGMGSSVPVVVLMDGTVVTGRIKNG